MTTSEPLTFNVEHQDLPQLTHQACIPITSPLHSHPMDEWLNCSLSDLHLHPQQWESRSWMWTWGAPSHTKGCPPTQRTVAECLPLDLVPRQVQFNLGKDLDEAPSLPTELANFLGGNTTKEWTDAPTTQLP